MERPFRVTIVLFVIFGLVSSESYCGDRCLDSSLAAFRDRRNLHYITDYVWDQIVASYTHLMFSNNFNLYIEDRPGFRKLYKGLSDKAWERALDLVKYYTLRGGKPIFNIALNLTNLWTLGRYPTKLTELKSLEQAVLLEKILSDRAYKMHDHFSSHKGYEINDLDAGVAHYVEEELLEYQAQTIRKLTGYFNDFHTLFYPAKCQTDINGALACYMFDKYLQDQA